METWRMSSSFWAGFTAASAMTGTPQSLALRAAARATGRMALRVAGPAML